MMLGRASGVPKDGWTQALEFARVDGMDKTMRIDIIDKLLDSIDKRLEVKGFFVSQEITYFGKKAIAARLGCSVSTASRLMDNGKLMYYNVYLGLRKTIRSNETMIRLSYRAWFEASRTLSASRVPRPRRP